MTGEANLRLLLRGSGPLAWDLGVPSLEECVQEA